MKSCVVLCHVAGGRRKAPWLFSPSALQLGGGGFGDVDGLFQSSAQVDGSLLDDLPDVFDPVLFVLDT